MRQDFCQSLSKLWPLIAAISEEFSQKRELARQRFKHQNAAVAVLNIRRMHHRLQQKAYRIDENVPLLAFDLFARIIAMRVNAGPPFSALFTLWLSITQAVGLALWPAAGLVDTGIRCFIELEEQDATKEAQPRVQA